MVPAMSLVDQSLTIVRAAVRRFKKLPLASAAGISDHVLRKVHEPDWDPRSTTLRRLEKAAAELEKEHGPESPDVHRETTRRNPAKPRGRA
jgi:cobalamin biosynthesis Mg chelatase CobN